MPSAPQERTLLREDVLMTLLGAPKGRTTSVLKRPAGPVFFSLLSQALESVVPAMAASHATTASWFRCKETTLTHRIFTGARHFVSKPMRAFTAWLRTLVPRSTDKTPEAIAACAS